MSLAPRNFFESKLQQSGYCLDFFERWKSHRNCSNNTEKFWWWEWWCHSIRLMVQKSQTTTWDGASKNPINNGDTHHPWWLAGFLNHQQYDQENFSWLQEMLHWKQGSPKRKSSSSNHWFFRGELLVFREGYLHLFETKPRAWDSATVQLADGLLGFGWRAVCQNGRTFAHPLGFDLKLRGLRGLEGRVSLEIRVHVGK